MSAVTIRATLGVKLAAINEAEMMLSDLKIEVKERLTIGKNACLMCRTTQTSLDTLVKTNPWWLMYSIAGDEKDESPGLELL